jgi:hypothetical protein
MRIKFRYHGVDRVGGIIDLKAGSIEGEETSGRPLLFLVQCDHIAHPQWFKSKNMMMMRSVEFDGQKAEA